MAAAEAADTEGKNFALYLNVTGLDDLVANNTLTASFVADVNGVKIAYSVTYTVQ